MSILDEYYASNHWHLMSLQRKRRDGFKCLLCCGLDIQVHHNSYDRLGHEAINDLVTLCCRCHRIYHVEVMICVADLNGCVRS